MSALKNALLQTRNVTVANSQGGDKSQWKTSLAHFLSKEYFPELYECYQVVGGDCDAVPYVTTEQQVDHVIEHDHRDVAHHPQSVAHYPRSAANQAVMRRMQLETQAIIERNDLAHNIQTRIISNGAKKYGLQKNDTDDYEGRKQNSVNMARRVLLNYGASDAMAFLDDAHMSLGKLDDLCDADGIGLEAGIKKFQESRKVVAQPDIGVMRMLGVDFGTRNFSFCLHEIVHVGPAALERYRLDNGTIVSRRLLSPTFRILRWELIDLEEGVVKASFRPVAPLPLYTDLRRREAKGVPLKSLTPPPLPRRTAKAKKEHEQSKQQQVDTFVINLVDSDE
jgi:hypothetical protein